MEMQERSEQDMRYCAMWSYRKKPSRRSAALMALCIVGALGVGGLLGTALWHVWDPVQYRLIYGESEAAVVWTQRIVTVPAEYVSYLPALDVGKWPGSVSEGSDGSLSFDFSSQNEFSEAIDLLRENIAVSFSSLEEEGAAWFDSFEMGPQWTSATIYTPARREGIADEEAIDALLCRMKVLDFFVGSGEVSLSLVNLQSGDVIASYVK